MIILSSITMKIPWNLKIPVKLPFHSAKRCFRSSLYPSFYPQPTSQTHSYLLQPKEVTPGLSTDEFSRRRHHLMQRITEYSRAKSNKRSAHLVVVPSNTVTYMSENIPYPFRQNTDFLYLCGCKEKNSVLLLHTVGNESSEYESVMFMPKGSAHTDRWEGLKMDLPIAVQFFGVNNALYMDDFENFLHSFLKTNNKITLWYNYLNTHFRFAHETMRDFITSNSNNVTVESPHSILHQIRVLKSESEANLMRKTCHIAAESLKEVIKCSRSQILESHLHAKMDYECRVRGADFLAFPPVVAGADRANTIHYIENNQMLYDGDLILMDAGCECHGYTSDLARTWPVNGKFTEPQKEIYEIVLSVQEELIQLCSNKSLSLDNFFQIMCETMGQKLQSIGLISPNASKEEIYKAAYGFCPHHVSHYLGMDVHDTNLISRDIKLHAGMVVTIEPGIYISKNNDKVPEKYRGICVRIEDDILITKDGFEILTAACPKSVYDIEMLSKS